MEELEKVSKELRRSATLQVQQHYELTSTLELLALAAYVSKDDLVSHCWKERPIGHANCICPSTGERQGQKVGVGG
jgi:DNA-binding winged helix-turn-helix (wHTH) protein